MTLIGDDLNVAIGLLNQNNIVAIPTETVYGLAGNALSAIAVTKIYTTKNRPFTSPLIIHIHDIQQLNKYVKNIPENALKLATRFWPGPLTLLLPKSDLVPDIVTSGSSNVAIRIPNHPTTLKLLQQLDFPLAAPSANPFGYISPTNPEHVKKQLNGKIPYILDGGTCDTGIESTIVGFENETPIIYRVGAISFEEIKNSCNDVKLKNEVVTQSVAPGMTKSHYSPNTPLLLTEDIDRLIKTLSINETGVLSFQNTHPLIPVKNQIVLSATGSLDEAAKNLYQAMHHLDSLNLKQIVAEKVPNVKIGVAINDRLTKAANK